MLQGELMEQKTLSGSIEKEVIQTGGGDVSGKLDKVTEETATPQVYAKDKDGSQTMLNAVQYYADDRNGLARFINGNLIVNTPTESGHATHKKYVDDNFVAKNKRLTGNRVYVSQSSKDEQGNNVFTDNTVGYATGEQANTLALRDSSGRLYGVCTANSGNATLTTKQYVETLLNGANKAVSFINYSSMISSLNNLGNTSYNVGQNIMIVTLNVPDLWVSEIAETSVAYTYVSDDDFINELTTNGSVQVGYYKLSALETQKVDLTDYAKLVDLDTKVSKVEYSKNQTFADGSDAGVVGRLYMRFRDNTENSIVANCQNTRYSVPVRDSTGNFYVGNPQQLYHTVNLISVTALQGEGAPTESTVALFEGQFYHDKTNNKTYQCTAIDKTNKVYTWTQIIRATDYAIDNGQAGIVKTIGTTYGVRTSTNGLLFIDGASKPQILDKATTYKPITPNTLDYAVKVGLTTNTEEWTDEEKASARELLGVSEGGSGGISIKSEVLTDTSVYSRLKELIENNKFYKLKIVLVGSSIISGTNILINTSDGTITSASGQFVFSGSNKISEFSDFVQGTTSIKFNGYPYVLELSQDLSIKLIYNNLTFSNNELKISTATKSLGNNVTYELYYFE